MCAYDFHFQRIKQLQPGSNWQRWAYQVGKPLPSVTWWRESVLLDDTYTVTPHGVVRNELEILSLKRHDLMAVFTCQASNNNFSQPALAAVTVDMNCKYSHYSMTKSSASNKCPINPARYNIFFTCCFVGYVARADT
ncbi:UNVERIFIED_CONTAM: hypothetical protein NCL1_12353 [Trichonephila clavipes]